MANSHSLTLVKSSSQFAYCADSASLSITGSITLEMWIKLTQLPSTAASTFALMYKYKDTATVASSFGWTINNTDKISFTFFGTTAEGNQSRVTTNAAAFTGGDVGVWRHVAISVTTATPSAVIYKDGSVLASTFDLTAGTSIADSTAQFMIGAGRESASGIHFADMKIDEARVWNVARTAGEISGNMRTELSTNTNLKGYWKFNNSAVDLSGNGNNLTLSGSPSYSTDVPFVDSSSLFFTQF